MKDTKIFLKKNRQKSNNMVVKVTNIFQEMEKVTWLGIGKIQQNEKKTF